MTVLTILCEQDPRPVAQPSASLPFIFSAGDFPMTLGAAQINQSSIMVDAIDSRTWAEVVLGGTLITGT